MSNAPTRIFLTWALAIAMTLAGTPAFAQTIVDEWATVKTPPAPELKPVTIGNPKETALLMLDFVKQICSPQARPRCVASLPKVQRLLTQARAKGVQVIYTLAGQSVADIWPEVAPAYGEPSVSSGPDKYIGTDLEKILKEKGIKTLIAVGVASEGAVLHTTAASAFRGLKVIVPVDGASSSSIFAELYTAWHLVNAPRLGAQVTLTRLDLIGF